MGLPPPDVVAHCDLSQLPARWPCAVSGFLAIHDEIDPLPLMTALADQGCTLALPVIEKKAAPLVFRAWTPGDALVEKMWGIREPVEAASIVEPDLVLTPLLAVDREGYRLGYGGGFYDRTLAKLRATKAITALGLAYDEQVIDHVPRDRYDIPCDWVLTPSALLRCGHLGSPQ